MREQRHTGFKQFSESHIAIFARSIYLTSYWFGENVIVGSLN